MSAYQKSLGSFFVGLYAWMITASFGMVLLDIFYAKQIPEATTAFSEVSDFLLLTNFVTLLCAILAIAFAWKSKIARNLLIASQFILFFELLIPALVSLFVQNPDTLSIGPWLRIIPSGAGSVLAFAGMYKYCSTSRKPA